MKTLLCRIGIHRHEPIKRIKKQDDKTWIGCDVPTCARCGHKKQPKVLTRPMRKAEADRWLKRQK